MKCRHKKPFAYLFEGLPKNMKKERIHTFNTNYLCKNKIANLSSQIKY